METAEAKAPTMGNILAMEMEHEAATARNLIERLPEDKFDWQPHDKSMTLGRLANHVVEAFEWTGPTVNQDVLDFAEMDYKPVDTKTTAELLTRLDNSVKEAMEILNGASNEELMKPWTMKEGEKVYLTMPKVSVVRSFVLNHMIHHRGQLSVYARLNDVPLPSIYGPTADEPDM